MNTYVRDDVQFLYNILHNVTADNISINGTLAIAGALTGVTSLTMSGALSGVTTLAMGGALSGVTTISASGQATINGVHFPLDIDTFSASTGANTTPANIISAHSLPSSGTWLLLGTGVTNGGTNANVDQVTFSGDVTTAYIRYDQSQRGSCPLIGTVSGGTYTIAVVATNAANLSNVGATVTALKLG